MTTSACSTVPALGCPERPRPTTVPPRPASSLSAHARARPTESGAPPRVVAVPALTVDSITRRDKGVTATFDAPGALTAWILHDVIHFCISRQKFRDS